MAPFFFFFLSLGTHRINTDQMSSGVAPTGHVQLPLDIQTQQVDENDPALLVVVHSPSSGSWMGSLHPTGSLYEMALDLDAARREHEEFRRVLTESGCKVLTVYEILTMNCSSDIRRRVELEEFALKYLSYKLVDTDPETLSESDRALISDEYKRQVIEKMSDDQLVNVIFTAPTIELKKADKDTALLACNYSFHPLVNLVFTRDQVITTCKGLVMTALSSPIRVPEVAVLKFCYQKLGLKIVGEIPSPGKLEGGDFFPCGRELCMIGVGLRSNIFACNYLMENDLLGTERVAIVKDYFDMDQQRMHLDTVCNLIAPQTMIILETILGPKNPRRRLVDEYRRRESGLGYELVEHDIEFSEYLSEHLGYRLIPLTEQNQFDYGCNGLNLGNGTLLTVDINTAKKIARSGVNLTIKNISFKNMTNMYGSLHCCSQVVSRRVSEAPPKKGTETHSKKRKATEQQEKLRETPSKKPRVRVATSRQSEQCATKFLLITPANFYVDTGSATDNHFMTKAAEVEKLLESVSGRRQLREKMLREFAELHAVLTTDCGVEVFLLTHEAYHNTPEAVFSHDWFSTFRSLSPPSSALSPAAAAAASPAAVSSPALVLHPMRSVHRQKEKRPDILELLKSMYPKVIDLSEFDFSAQHTQAFENCVTIDRISHTAYVGISPRNSHELAQAFAAQTQLKMIVFHTDSVVRESNFSGERAPFFHSDMVLFVGSTFAVLCEEALYIEEERKRVRTSLEQTGHSIILISLHQALSFCCSMREVFSPKLQTSALIMSERAYSAFLPEQISSLEKHVGKIFKVDMQTTEDVGGGSLGGLISPLF
eukprot:TRINITY_DN6438_c0_g1_i1.p1 TRINITY_DN6438_c0_g1~~TRINITY_DN6438_c0_g1_i1.p1  ORF type:complete len:825 (-),score=195.21 TRINITY_DN6438_c0_g1_i1:34-2508(-)